MIEIIEREYGSIDWELFTETIFDEEGNESDGEEYIRINNLEVYPEYRGNGYARTLMTEALEIIKAECPRMRIKIVAEPKDKTTDFSRLVAFYESFDEIDEVLAF